MADSWGGSWGTSWLTSWGAETQATPGLTRRKHAAERLARRRIEQALEVIEAVAEKPVTPRAVAKAEQAYERIQIQATTLPDTEVVKAMLDSARDLLMKVKAAEALRRRHDDEWLILT